MALQRFTDQEILDFYRNIGQIHPDVYGLFNKQAFARLLKTGAREEVAEEIVYESWVPLLLKLPKFVPKGDGSLYAFFLQTCLRKFFTWCRQNKRKPPPMPEITDPEEGDWEERKELMMRYLQEFRDKVLKGKCRELMHYRFAENKSHAEIDQIFGAKNAEGTSSSKNQLYRCLNKLRAQFKNFGF
ncbi:MAG: hypothetical protein IPJ00_12700 [Saprospirales bacterium]|nr:hypothetical protein [Saprospirales bacterium]